MAEAVVRCLRCITNATVGRRKKQALILYLIGLTFCLVLYYKYKMPKELYERKEDWLIRKEMDSKITAFKMSLKERWTEVRPELKQMTLKPIRKPEKPSAVAKPSAVMKPTTTVTKTQIARTKAPPVLARNVDCANKPQSEYLFCKFGADPMQRALDLVSRLTTEELINQTSNKASAIPRLGIKDYNWRSNCLHGWSESKGKWREDLKWTVFPAPIALAATFDADLVRTIGGITATEGRALHNEMLRTLNGSSREAAGLNCFSPNVNLLRDPRWGRAQETFGEDPYLISVLGTAYTRGLQEGPDKKYLLVASCAKHFAVHSGPEDLRYQFVSSVSMHDLYDTYLPAFRSQVMGAKVSQVMPAYSGLRCYKQTDGAPDVANPFLLKTLLREEFQAPNISVCSDFDALEFIITQRAYVMSFQEAAGLSMNASTDIDLGDDLVYTNYLQIALTQNLVTLDTIKKAVTRSILLRMRLGDFDPPSKVIYQSIDKNSIDTQFNRETNLKAAQESIVLLKNTEKALPLDKTKLKNLVILGPNAFDPGTQLSSYEGIPAFTMSVYEGILEAVKNSNITLGQAFGCNNVRCESSYTYEYVLRLVSDAEYVIMVMGLKDGVVEGESTDRVQTMCDGETMPLLGLPGCQRNFVEAVAQMKKVILVLFNGGPVSIPNLLHNHNVVGIIEAFYPGGFGGAAVADVLFGNYNPSGKMPVSVYESEIDLPLFTNYDMNAPPGRTYRYSSRKPLIPFGFGLSYADFKYKNLTLVPELLNACDSLLVNVTLQNESPQRAGEEIVQVYLVPVNISLPKYFTPLNELIGFRRISLSPKQTGSVLFTINAYLLSLVNADGDRYLYPGVYLIQLGLTDYHLKHLFTLRTATGQPVNIATCKGVPACITCEP